MWQIAPALLLLTFLFILPLLGVVRTSLYPGNRSFNAVGFTAFQYLKLLSDSFYLQTLFDTIMDGVIVAIVCLILGFPVGYSLARLPARKRRWRLILVILPLTLSLVVIVFGWMIVLGRNGVVNNLMMWLGLFDHPAQLLYNRTVVRLVLVQQFLPFMILSVMSTCTQISPVLEQAAANLRANRFTTLRKVVLPMAMPGIISGMTLVFILTVSAFVTPRLVGGGKVHMLGSIIYEQTVVALNWPLGAALSIVLLVLTTLITGVTNMVLTNKFAKHHGARHAK